MRRDGLSGSRHLASMLVVAMVVSLFVAGVAVAGGAMSLPSFTPRSADQITNIDVLRSQIKNYYGDPGGTGAFAADSNYAKEASSVAADGARWLSTGWRGKASVKKAIVLDVDDTTLATWNYEIYSNWAYNYWPSSTTAKHLTNADFVHGQLFPAVPGMVDMVNQAKDEGYAIIFLTGRPGDGQLDNQEADTVKNLTNVGYLGPTPLPDATLGGGSDGMFTKPAVSAYPPYLQTACAVEIRAGKSCTTIHYKSATRAYVESLGYDIVASFGDQYSDFTGGYADKTFKMPNPNYYLP